MEKEETELVWLPKSVAEKVKEVTDDKKKETLILRFIEDAKHDIQSNLESLDEDVIRFKGSMIKAKNAFEEAKNEQLNATYEVWEKYDKDLSKLTAKVDGMIAKLEPLTAKLEKVNELLDKTRSYQIKDLLEILREMNSHLNSKGDTAKILKFLFENYNRE